MAVICTLFLLILPTAGGAWAQTNTGSWTIMGTASLSTTSGDGSVTVFNLSPRAHYFVADQVGMGGRLEFSSISSGDTTFTDVLFGPDGVYFFKTSIDELLPFAGLGLFLSHYSNEESTTGFTFSLHGGLAYLLREHLSIFPELSVNLASQDSHSTTSVVLGVGLAGFLY
jgi:hypothetical protein